MVEESRQSRRNRRAAPQRLIAFDVIALTVLAGLSAFFLSQHWGRTAGPPAGSPAQSALATPSTAPTVPPPTTTTTSTLPPPGPGFVAGHVTAVGDSVMLDYQDELETDIPGIQVDAAVSRQWSDGLAILQELKASGQLGAEVIVGLGTNGPITDSDFDAMMQTLDGASRVVFVNTHVDRPWQDANNAVIAAGAARYPDVVVADWSTLAAQNPQWFGADGTHLAIDGPGADALASLITSTLSTG
jgi:hypothetical protein